MTDPVTIAARRGQDVAATLQRALDEHARYDSVISIGVHRRPDSMIELSINCSNMDRHHAMGILADALDVVSARLHDVNQGLEDED